MKNRPAPSPLATAAESLHQELEHFSRVAEEALGTPLDSQKHLERAGRLLTQLCDVEQTMGGKLRGLVAAIGEARERQESLAGRIQAWATELQARTDVYADLMKSLEALGPEVVAASESLRDAIGDPAVVGEARARVVDVAARAGALADEAEGKGFKDVARLARARQESLSAVVARLDRVTTAAS